MWWKPGALVKKCIQGSWLRKSQGSAPHFLKKRPFPLPLLMGLWQPPAEVAISFYSFRSSAEGEHSGGTKDFSAMFPWRHQPAGTASEPSIWEAMCSFASCCAPNAHMGPGLSRCLVPADMDDGVTNTCTKCWPRISSRLLVHMQVCLGELLMPSGGGGTVKLVTGDGTEHGDIHRDSPTATIVLGNFCNLVFMWFLLKCIYAIFTCVSFIIAKVVVCKCNVTLLQLWKIETLYIHQYFNVIPELSFYVMRLQMYKFHKRVK